MEAQDLLWGPVLKFLHLYVFSVLLQASDSSPAAQEIHSSQAFCELRVEHLVLLKGVSSQSTQTLLISPPSPLFRSHLTFLLPSSHLPQPHWEFSFTPSAAAAAAKLLQSCPTLCDPIDSSPPGSPVPGVLQARTLEWVAFSFSNA